MTANRITRTPQSSSPVFPGATLTLANGAMSVSNVLDSAVPTGFCRIVGDAR